jgi:hypothetical protein
MQPASAIFTFSLCYVSVCQEHVNKEAFWKLKETNTWNMQEA